MYCVYIYIYIVNLLFYRASIDSSDFVFSILLKEQPCLNMFIYIFICIVCVYIYIYI